MLIFNSPNNPTGTVFSDAVLEKLARLSVKHDLWVIADEIYARILFSGEYKSIWSLPGMAERTVIIDGFSKSFAMTGWRLGYAVAPIGIAGAAFGLGGKSYLRFSLVSARKLLEEALERMQRASVHWRAMANR